MYILHMSMMLKKEEKTISLNCLKKCFFLMIFKIRYKLYYNFPWQLQAMSLKTARQTSQRRTADLLMQHGSLSTQHSPCCLQKHAPPYLVGHVSQDSTARKCLLKEQQKVFLCMIPLTLKLLASESH